LEHQVRKDAVEFASVSHAQGWPVEDLAQMLHLAARTLRSWGQRLRQLSLSLGWLGRPTKRAALPVRQRLLEVLEEVGPGVSVADLRPTFPEIGRRELEDFLARYRRVWRWRHSAQVPVLRWPQAGRVWAMDFTEAEAPIDGCYPYLLAVRDLASGQQLLAWPTTDMTETSVRCALGSLFTLYGAPLVLKTDNGSAFRAEAAQQYLRHWGVTSLFSPPRMPRYNGAIEAGIGSLKMRIHRLAAHQGHPGVWHGQDVEAARLEANATGRPRGSSGPTPDEVWAARSSVSHQERTNFQATVASHRAAELAQTASAASGAPPAAEGDLLWSHKEFVDEDRRAVRRALEACGYLFYSRRRFHLPIPGKITAMVS
jgi:transposase InsO family protein